MDGRVLQHISSNLAKKKINLNLIKPLDTTTNSQKTEDRAIC